MLQSLGHCSVSPEVQFCGLPARPGPRPQGLASPPGSHSTSAQASSPRSPWLSLFPLPESRGSSSSLLRAVGSLWAPPLPRRTLQDSEAALVPLSWSCAPASPSPPHDSPPGCRGVRPHCALVVHVLDICGSSCLHNMLPLPASTPGTATNPIAVQLKEHTFSWPHLQPTPATKRGSSRGRTC